MTQVSVNAAKNETVGTLRYFESTAGHFSQLSLTSASGGSADGQIGRFHEFRGSAFGQKQPTILKRCVWLEKHFPVAMQHKLER